MLTVRCTQKLIKRLRLPPDVLTPHPPEPTTVLGDWYATIIVASPSHLVMCVSEKSRLCVVVPALQLRTHFAAKFQEAVRTLLRDIGIPARDVDRELIKMESLWFADTSGAPLMRSILGTMNDYLRMLKYDLHRYDTTLAERGRILSCTPVGPLQYRSPDAVTRDLFAAQSGQSAATQPDLTLDFN